MSPELPLTVSVAEIVVSVLREAKLEGRGLDRDEAYLLARLEAAPPGGMTDALLIAIAEAQPE